MLPKDLSHLTIRSATNDDRESVAELVFGVLAEYGLEPDPETTDADLQDIEANYLQRGGLFEVIKPTNWICKQSQFTWKQNFRESFCVRTKQLSAWSISN
jgi:hypothetical protein